MINYYEEIMGISGEAGLNEPIYKIKFEGHDVSSQIDKRLISLSIDDALGDDADQVEIVLDDTDGAVAIPRPGGSVSVAVGWAITGTVEKGVFVIDEVKVSGVPDRVEVRARSVDRTQKLPGQRSESYHKTTLGEVVKKIAGRHGLKAVVSDGLSAVRVAHVDQVDESDLSFLARILRTSDAVVTVKAGKILVMKEGAAKSATGKDMPEVAVDKKDVGSYHFADVTADTWTGVKARYNAKSHAKLSTVVVGSGENAKVLKGTYTSESDARRAAKSEMDRIKRGRFTFGFLLAYGRPDITAGCVLWAQGFKERVDKVRWIVKSVRHELSEGGYVTSVECEAADEKT